MPDLDTAIQIGTAAAGAGTGGTPPPPAPGGFDDKIGIAQSIVAGKPIPKDIIGTPYAGDVVVDPNAINITVRPQQRIPAGTIVGNQPPPEANGPTVGNIMASGAEAGVGGLAGTPVDLAQMVGNAGIFLRNKVADQFAPSSGDPNDLFTHPDQASHVASIPDLPGGSKWMLDKMTAAGLKPRRDDLTKPWQRYLFAATAGAAGQLPTLAIPGAGEVRLAKILSDAGIGAGSGIASEGAQEAARWVDPNNPGLQATAGFVGGLLPGAGGTVARMAGRPFTAAGQRAIAGRVLAQEGRGAPVAPAANLPPGFRPTVGQTTNAPGYLRLERTLEQAPDLGPEFQARQQQNQAALRANLDTLRTGQSSDDASTAIDRGIRAYRKAMKDQERNLWDAVDPGNTVPLVSGYFRTRVNTSIGREPVAYQRLIPPEIAQDLAQLGYNTTVREIHAILSKTKEAARNAAYAGEANKARIVGKIAEAIQGELTNQMVRAVGQNGAAVRQRFMAANRVSRFNAQTYKQNPIGAVLAKDATGAPRVQPTAVAGKLLGSGAGQAERWAAFKKSVNNNPHAIAAARDWFVNRLIDAAVQSDGTVSPAALERFVRANRSLMGTDIFTPVQRQLVDRIGRAASMAQNVARGGPRGGSDTAAKLLGSKYVDVLIGSLTSKMIHGAGAAVGGALGHTIGAGAGEFGGLYAGFKGAEALSRAMDRLYSLPAEKVKLLLRDALLDPALATDLMREARAATPLPRTLARYLLADYALNRSGALPAATPAGP